MFEVNNDRPTLYAEKKRLGCPVQLGSIVLFLSNV